MKINILKTLIIVLLFPSCKTNSNTQKAKTETSSEKVSSKNTTDILVEFYSICCGTDNKAYQAFQKIIAQYPKLENETYHWGKEGEFDYCMDLSNLSTNERESLKKSIQQVADSSKLVRVKENAPCVHKK